jgi:membrane protease YdiL (CAAX protease family)
VPEPDLAPSSPAAGGGAVPVAHREPSWGFGDAVVGWVVSLVLGQVVGSLVLTLSGEEEFTDLSMGVMVLANTGLWAGFVGWSWYVTRRKGGGLVHDLGLRIEVLDVPMGVVWGLVSQIVILPLLYVPIFLFTDISAKELSEPARDLTDRATGPFGVVMLVVFVGICAPICEEIFYRGLVLRSLERRLGQWPAVVLTGVIFGASHFEPLQFVGLAVFGAVLSVLVLRSGRLGPAIVAHMVFNLLAVVNMLAAGR